MLINLHNMRFMTKRSERGILRESRDEGRRKKLKVYFFFFSRRLALRAKKPFEIDLDHSRYDPSQI